MPNRVEAHEAMQLPGPDVSRTGVEDQVNTMRLVRNERRGQGNDEVGSRGDEMIAGGADPGDASDVRAVVHAPSRSPSEGLDLDAGLVEGEPFDPSDLSVLSPNTLHQPIHSPSGMSVPQHETSVLQPPTTQAHEAEVANNPETGLSSAEEGSLGGYSSDDDDNDQ